jgi:hypothetical protein
MPQYDAFEDSSSGGTKLWGVYGARLLATEAGRIDALYLGVDRERSIYSQGVGAEKRHTIGARWAGQRGPWRQNYEAFYQFGDFESSTISAWSVITENYYELSGYEWRPTVGLGVNAASGDEDPNDDTLQTFDSPFPNLSYLSAAPIYTPRNLYDLQVLVDLFPHEDLRLRLRSNALWRQNTNDDVYATRGVPLVASVESNERFIGYLLDATIRWGPTPNLSFEASYVHAVAGSAISDAGGIDSDYFFMNMAFRF